MIKLKKDIGTPAHVYVRYYYDVYGDKGQPREAYVPIGENAYLKISN